MDAQEAINTIWKNACFKCKHADSDFRCTACKNCEYSGERNYIESKTYCGGNYSGIIGRFKRAWKAFFGKTGMLFWRVYRKFRQSKGFFTEMYGTG